jgi:NADH-quinone oxidoreductase subunit C
MAAQVGIAACLECCPDNAALLALNGIPGLLADAKFDRDEMTLTVPREKIVAACEAIKQAGYNFLEDVTCVDWYPSEPRFQVTYHILSHRLKQRVRLIAMVAESDAVIDTIIPVWPSANFYEREIFDLFGVRFNQHPNLIRIMMPDEWEGHPLRKDYPVEGYR